MSKLCQEIAVGMPAADAEQGILRYFELHRRGGEVELPLRIDLRDFGVPAAPALEHQVQVRITRRRDSENINDEIGISWAPLDGGPYPFFNGRLIVWGSGIDGESFIELSGEYEPPGGTAGKFFDDAIGHLIAERTAYEFLAALRDGIVAIKETPNAFNR